jgi:sugar-specific transcriptional regulator TrmB
LGLDGETGTLLHLGLTNSQAKVYLALLRLAADCKGTTIAQFANVPRQDVYRLLAELQKIGIIRKTIARPATYKAVCAKEAIEILLNRKISDFSKLKREGNVFVKRAQENLIPRMPQSFSEDEVDIIVGREAITSKIREGSLRAQVTARSITPYNELIPWLSVCSKSLDEELSRGIKIKWIIEKNAAINRHHPVLRRYVEKTNFELRVINQPIKTKVTIFDSKEAFIGMVTDSDFTLSPALFSNNSSIVAMAESYFESCWKISTDIDCQVLWKNNIDRKNAQIIP